MSQILMKDLMVDFFLILVEELNNGFIRLGHSVLGFSDRDIQKYYKSLNDLKDLKL